MRLLEETLRGETVDQLSATATAAEEQLRREAEERLEELRVELVGEMTRQLALKGVRVIMPSNHTLTSYTHIVPISYSYHTFISCYPINPNIISTDLPKCYLPINPHILSTAPPRASSTHRC